MNKMWIQINLGMNKWFSHTGLVRVPILPIDKEPQPTKWRKSFIKKTLGLFSSPLLLTQVANFSYLLKPYWHLRLPPGYETIICMNAKKNLTLYKHSLRLHCVLRMKASWSSPTASTACKTSVEGYEIFRVPQTMLR